MEMGELGAGQRKVMLGKSLVRVGVNFLVGPVAKQLVKCMIRVDYTRMVDGGIEETRQRDRSHDRVGRRVNPEVKRPDFRRLSFLNTLRVSGRQSCRCALVAFYHRMDSSRTVTPVAPARRSLRPFEGMLADVKARAPYYLSDWTDAWTYRVVPATAMIFFANILPGIAFSLDLIETTDQYGVIEVLLSSFMAAVIFSVFSCQPLCIAGVTGPITVLNKTIYDILKTRNDAPEYLHFIGWVYLWAAIMHWIAAAFGFYVAWVYLQYGVQVLTRQLPVIDSSSVFVSIILALVMLVTGHLFGMLARSGLGHRLARRFCADYGMPISVVACSGLAYWGRFNLANPLTLPTSGAFSPAGGRPWLVKFWELDGKWVGIALPGLLGVPAPNGLIPQAPMHTSSLVVMGVRPKDDPEKSSLQLGVAQNYEPADSPTDASPNHMSEEADTIVEEHPIGVVEQRVSNLAQGALCIVLMTGPFQHVLGLVPRARGFSIPFSWFMGTDALRTSGVTEKLLYLIRDPSLIPRREPLRQVRRSRVALFVAIELLGFGATMAITQTIGTVPASVLLRNKADTMSVAAIGFPIVIMLLVPIRTLVIPRLPFTDRELAVLDGPTASPFTMASVGGSI
ncbi:anion exchange family protein [Rhizoctonia solani AG-1 IA]|uniref:Anion exchange family protein n=1 Tax=Thanatephorus cucumeris (strain AG1-IA) TaxID=983506 RepID=L8X107_THACA|nr:anion exchange family protein [Rhizoctonia solani AG-1 IA]